MLLKILIIIMLLFVFGSLFISFYHLMRGEQNEKVVKALIGFYTGFIGNPNPTPS
jgi:hypothetical protein